MLANTTLAIILQYINLSNQQIIHLKLKQVMSVIYNKIRVVLIRFFDIRNI